jgi:hypothetical protein
MKASTSRPPVVAPARSCDAASAWAELLPFAEAEDVREWLDERGAFLLYQRGARDLADSATWPIVAGVLALVMGHPSDVIEGVALV